VYAADEYVVKKRAHHGSGSDFLMVEEGETDEQFVRLEVSGVGQGESRLVSRLRNKVRQLEEGNLRRPGVAAVVGFEAATVLLEDCPL